jgi:hypothetical protein
MDTVTYILLKNYIEDLLENAGALQGKSAYEIACENGFKGTPAEWLASLKGSELLIRENGNWIIDGVDTGMIASPNVEEALAQKTQVQIFTWEDDD